MPNDNYGKSRRKDRCSNLYVAAECTQLATGLLYFGKCHRAKNVLEKLFQWVNEGLRYLSVCYSIIVISPTEGSEMCAKNLGG